MKKLALLLLVLPLPAFAADASAPAKSAQEATRICDSGSSFFELCMKFEGYPVEHHQFVSHWDVVSGRGAFLATGGEAAAASTGDASYPAGSYGGR